MSQMKHEDRQLEFISYITELIFLKVAHGYSKVWPGPYMWSKFRRLKYVTINHRDDSQVQLIVFDMIAANDGVQFLVFRQDFRLIDSFCLQFCGCLSVSELPPSATLRSDSLKIGVPHHALCRPHSRLPEWAWLSQVAMRDVLTLFTLAADNVRFKK